MKKRMQLNINLKVQLFIGFMVPILFLILVGNISYQKAAEGMVSNYENSALETIKTKMQYLDFGLNMINSDAIQLKLDSELESLVSGAYENDMSKSSSVLKKALTNLNARQTSNSLIEDIYIIPESGYEIVSTRAEDGSQGNQESKGFLEDWLATEEGQGVLNGSNTGHWLGRHEEIDAGTGYDTEGYLLSLVTLFPSKNAVMVIDINRDVIKETLSSIDTKEGALVGYVTSDGYELVIKEGTEAENFCLSEQSFFQSCLEQESAYGTEYVTFNGEDYFYIYCKSDITGAAIGYLVPEEKIIGSADELKSITVVLVIIACVVALIIGLVISMNISFNMAGIIKKLKMAAGGDLTVQMNVRGKNEFRVLSKNIMDMISHTRKLILKVDSIVAMVAGAADDVEKVSGDMEESSHGIITALSEIDEGMGHQALDAQDCLVQMDTLSQAIDQIGEDIGKTRDGSSETEEIVSKSLVKMETLFAQTKDTIEVTEKVKNDVKILEKKSGIIQEFVNTINEMAEQTNLLSLNASIEAARAGEAGRGFAVVAEEIRKLADGSGEAANEIGKVVEEIILQTKETVATAQKAEVIVNEQAESVETTKEDFHNISNCTKKMINNVLQIADNVKTIETKRAGTLEAIASISAVSEEIAASSTNVYNIAQGQSEVVESLKSASAKLKEMMEELEEALDEFVTEGE